MVSGQQSNGVSEGKTHNLPVIQVDNQVSIYSELRSLCQSNWHTECLLSWNLFSGVLIATMDSRYRHNHHIVTVVSPMHNGLNVQNEAIYLGQRSMDRAYYHFIV